MTVTADNSVLDIVLEWQLSDAKTGDQVAVKLIDANGRSWTERDYGPPGRFNPQNAGDSLVKRDQFGVQIPVDKIGLIIGPGGKTIRGIIENAADELDINIDESGMVTIASPDTEVALKAKKLIESMVEEPVVGKAYRGVVKSVKDFGAFVEFLPGREGMVHISELDTQRTNRVSDVVKEGDEIDVVVLRVEPNGKVALSRKAFLRRKMKQQKPTYKKKF